jgi:hypothetical protein
MPSPRRGLPSRRCRELCTEADSESPGSRQCPRPAVIQSHWRPATAARFSTRATARSVSGRSPVHHSLTGLTPPGGSDPEGKAGASPRREPESEGPQRGRPVHACRRTSGRRGNTDGGLPHRRWCQRSPQVPAGNGTSRGGGSELRAPLLVQMAAHPHQGDRAQVLATSWRNFQCSATNQR